MQHHPNARTRFRATVGAALLAATALLLTPTTATADPGTTYQTTDPAGDGRIQLLGPFGGSNPIGPNQPTSDLLAAGARVDATTVTFFVRLAAAPTLNQLLTDSNYRYGNTIRLGATGGNTNADVIIQTDLYVYESLIYVSGPGVGGLDDGPAIVAGYESVDAASGEIRYTVSRSDLDYAIALAGSGNRPLSPGAQLQVTGATARALGANPIIGNPSDTAGPGPVTTVTG